MNSQRHSTTNLPPYEIVFNQRIHGQRVIYHERHTQEVLDEHVPNTDETQPVLTAVDVVGIDPQLLSDIQMSVEGEESGVFHHILQINTGS